MSLMDPFCVDAGWDESVSMNTLKVQIIHFLLLEHSGINIYAVVSSLCGEVLRMNLSVSQYYLSCNSFMETRNLLWDSLKNTGVSLGAKIYIFINITLNFSSFFPVLCGPSSLGAGTKGTHTKPHCSSQH